MKSYLKNLKKNNIYKILIKYKLIKNKNLSVLNNSTRDKKNLRSFIDSKTNIIFLEKAKKPIYYINKKSENKKITTRFGVFKDSALSDAKRRFFQFRKFVKNKTILDFGCGSGDFLHKSQNILKKGAGVELNFNKIRYSNNKKITFAKDIADLDNLNLKFDTIFLFHVFEHLLYPDQILQKLKSKLKKGGNLIIEVPHAKDILINKLKLKSFLNFTLWSEHIILHTKKSLNCFLKKSGFKKNKIYCYQRYDLNNHFGWIMYSKPGGHVFLKNMFDKKTINKYKEILLKNGISDTIYSISRNQ